MNKFTIRPAQEEECALLLSFIQKMAEFEKLAHEVLNNEALLRENVFRKKYAETYFLEEDNVVIGFAVFFFTYSTFTGCPTLYVEDVFIDEPYRGKGYGKKTFIFIAREAVARGCARMEWTVLDWNMPAVNFYHSIGAQPMDGWTVQRLSGKTLEDFANTAL